MSAIRVETIVETNGDLHLTNLPFREGDRVEAVLQVVGLTAKPNSAMLDALTTIEELQQRMSPKRSRRDYLREAREGAMYDLNDD